MYVKYRLEKCKKKSQKIFFATPCTCDFSHVSTSAICLITVANVNIVNSYRAVQQPHMQSEMITYPPNMLMPSNDHTYCCCVHAYAYIRSLFIGSTTSYYGRHKVIANSERQQNTYSSR